MIDFITDNWAELLLATMTFLKVVFNLLPSDKPIKVWGYLDILINAIIADNVRSTQEKA